MLYQLPRPAITACEVGFLHAGGGIPCRPHPPATQLVIIIIIIIINTYCTVNGCYSRDETLKQMWSDGARSITSVTKRPVTAGMDFKNSIIALVEKNLSMKVMLLLVGLLYNYYCYCHMTVVVDHWLTYRRCEVRLPARPLPCKNLGLISHTHVQCSPI